EALLDGGAAVRRDAVHQVSEARPWGRAGGGELLVEDDVEDRGKVMTAEAGRPGEAEKAGVVEGGVPLRLSRPVLVVGRRDRQPRIVLRDPAPETRAEPRLFRRVTKVHRALRDGSAPAVAAARRRLRTTVTRAAPGAGRRGRCSPTCSRSPRALA